MKLESASPSYRKKCTALALAAAALWSTAQANELATVISSTPILEQVSSPVTVCENKQVTVQGQKSGGGALMGAIAGGAIGDAIGEGSGRALATAIGGIGGAVLGDRIEGAPAPTTQSVQDCRQEYRTTTRTKAYRVAYEYAGKRYEVEMANDPGPTLPVQVSPVTSPTSSQSTPSRYSAPSAGSAQITVPTHSRVILAFRTEQRSASPRATHGFRPHPGHRGYAKRDRYADEQYAWR